MRIPTARKLRISSFQSSEIHSAPRHPCGVLRVTSPTFLRPVPAPKAMQSLEGFPVRMFYFLTFAEHRTLHQATRGSAGSGGGHEYYLDMSGTRLIRNNVRTKWITMRGPRSVFDLFFQIFQFSGDADLNVRHSHGYSSEGFISPCFSCSLGLREGFKYEVYSPIILIIPFIPTFPPSSSLSSLPPLIPRIR